MVVPIRELANKLFSTTAINIQPLQIAQFPSNMDMDINTNIIRGRSTSFSKVSSKKSSTHSTVSSTLYHQRMEIQNNFLDEDIQEPINSFQLSYVSNNKQTDKLVRLATDNSSQKRSQHVQNETPALNNVPEPQDEGVANSTTNTCPLQEAIDIQLPYNVN